MSYFVDDGLYSFKNVAIIGGRIIQASVAEENEVSSEVELGNLRIKEKVPSFFEENGCCHLFRTGTVSAASALQVRPKSGRYLLRRRVCDHLSL